MLSLWNKAQIFLKIGVRSSPLHISSHQKHTGMQCAFLGNSCAFPCNAIFSLFIWMGWNRIICHKMCCVHYCVKTWPLLIGWFCGTMRPGTCKHTAFAICIWGAVNNELAPALDCKGSTFWTRETQTERAFLWTGPKWCFIWTWFWKSQ